MLGGICLGPSLLGRIPGFTETFFPKSSLGILNLIANIGLVFYLFLVGLELEPQAFIKNLRLSLLISGAGIILPFSVGVACSYGLYSYLLVPNTYNVPFSSFLLFTGVAISITVRKFLETWKDAFYFQHFFSFNCFYNPKSLYFPVETGFLVKCKKCNFCLGNLPTHSDATWQIVYLWNLWLAILVFMSVIFLIIKI